MNKNTMGLLHMIAFILVVIGALNWGLVGLFNYNLVTSLLGMGSLTQLVYLLVGLSAVYLALTHGNDCGVCSMMMKPAKVVKAKKRKR